MHIRQATISDIDQLTPLFEGYRQFYKQAPNPSAAQAFLQARFERKESIIFVAFETVNEGKAIGFTQVYSIFSSISMERMMLLNDLFIHPEFRGKGVGKALIDNVKDRCRKEKQKGIVLQTETTNPAQRLYEREGFVIDPDLHYFWKLD